MGQGNTKSVLGWGSNEFHQLGNSSSSAKLVSPKVIEPARSCSVVCVSAKGTYSAVVLETGDIYTWGTGDSGQLGLGNGEFVSPIPRPLRGQLQGKIVKTVSCGLQHCAVVTDTNCLYTWGKGQNGRLGHGTDESEHIPRLVEGLLGVSVLSVSCGDYHTLCGTSSGVYSFGLGLSGRLGLETEEDQYLPTLVAGPVSQSGKSIMDVAAGGHHSMALIAPGVMYTWGGGAFGKLGHGDSTSCYTPKLVTAMSHVRVTDISLGQQHSAAITISGEVYVWGKAQGDMSEDLHVPTVCVDFADLSVAKIVCGKSQTFAVTHSEEVWARGPSSVELRATTTGFSMPDEQQQVRPLDLPTTNKQQCYCLKRKGVVALAVGDSHCLAMADPGRIIENATNFLHQPSSDISPELCGTGKPNGGLTNVPPPSLLHVVETVARQMPSVPPNASTEGEIAFLSNELRTAQSENKKLAAKLQDSLTRISHLEKENIALREELDASMQCGGMLVTPTTPGMQDVIVLPAE